MTPWWITFPWAAVGASVALIGLAVTALKLAYTWGGTTRTVIDHDRRIIALETCSQGVPHCIQEHDRRLLELEKGAKGVPDAIEAEVSAQADAAESAEAFVRHHLAKAAREVRNLQMELIAIKARCATIHGPPSQVLELEGDDSDELLLEPAKGTP